MMENTVNKNLKELLEHLLDVLDSDRQDKIENRDSSGRFL